MEQKTDPHNLPAHIPCPYCGRYKNRRLAVDAIIVKDSKILLIKRATEPFKDLWALPGGGVDYNETLEEALKKEVQEEVGLLVKSTKFLNIYSKPERDPFQVIALTYITEVTGNPKAGTDASEYQWFALDNLPKPLGFDHEKIIADYKRLLPKNPVA